ncbi:MAG: hypothetical protein PHR06_11930 [Candidatus Cloacimonetes bacterium]|nr:hypothetical protein [Candidatus Cloacimonadota bacterium]
MKNITVRDFFEMKKKDFALSLITNSLTLENIITEPHINKPGLALAGFHDLFDINEYKSWVKPKFIIWNP